MCVVLEERDELVHGGRDTRAGAIVPKVSSTQFSGKAASERIFAVAGSLTNFATPHMACISEASVKAFGGSVFLDRTLASIA